MLVKIKDAPDGLVSVLLDATGHKVASKAFLCAAAGYVFQLEEIAVLRQKLANLENRLAVAEQLIQRSRDSAAALLYHVAQGDLLND